MKRVINQINVSITTNRTCTLQCTHCYIAPHLFKDKTQMTEEVYRSVFDKIEQLKAIDRNLHEIEWEVIGGETTMMPFEWWERQLPWTLDRIEQINKGLRIPGSLNFLTNLIYADKRYTDLFNQYGDHPAFCLYTSWEPDTERFGKRNQLFKRFYDTLCSINAKQKILDIILTKEVISMGAGRILEMFLPAGITDFSMKMISPYGSGKAFFEPNQAEFHQMTQFFQDMHRLKPSNVTFTPQEEMLSSLMKGTSFQCNGNFKYDLSIEPDGVCHFNANQTADEAALGFRRIVIDDPDWAYKICFENKVEENNKLTLLHPECDQCEYLMHCNAGWYHYKIHDPKVIDRYRQQDCSGYRQFWDFNKNLLGTQVNDRSRHIHQLNLRGYKLPTMPDEPAQLESVIAKRYAEYFAAVKGLKAVQVDKPTAFGKKLLERLWFYDDLGVHTHIADDVLFSSVDADAIMEHILSQNMPCIHLTDGQVATFMASNSKLAMRCRDFCGLWLSFQGTSKPSQPFVSDLIVDGRHEEMFRSLIQWMERTGYSQEGRTPTDEQLGYLKKLNEFLGLEQLIVRSRA
jgi:hypothetical protein